MRKIFFYLIITLFVIFQSMGIYAAEVENLDLSNYEFIYKHLDTDNTLTTIAVANPFLWGFWPLTLPIFIIEKYKISQYAKIIALMREASQSKKLGVTDGKQLSKFIHDLKKKDSMLDEEEIINFLISSSQNGRFSKADVLGSYGKIKNLAFSELSDIEQCHRSLLSTSINDF